jgi:DnaJ-class molecular chaperone
MRRVDSDKTGTAEAETVDTVLLNEALDRLLDPLDRLTTSDAHPRTGDAGPVPAQRGTDVSVSVTLDASEVRTGARPVVRFTISEPCPQCSGSGFAEQPSQECGPCAGTGVVEADRVLAVRIPPDLWDGAELRVREEGNVSPDGVPGDLFVRVRVVPPAKRPKRTLYTVLAVVVVVLAVLAYLRFF